MTQKEKGEVHRRIAIQQTCIYNQIKAPVRRLGEKSTHKNTKKGLMPGVLYQGLGSHNNRVITTKWV